MIKQNNINKLLLTFTIIGILYLQNSNISVYGQPSGNAPARQPRMTEIVKNCEGKEFYLCFMINFRDDRGTNAKPLELMLFLTSEYDSKVNVEFPKEKYNRTIDVKAGTVVGVPLDRFAQATLFEMEDIGQAIHITSDNPINVYGLNRRPQSTDNYLAFPVEVLGTEYMVMSYYTFSSDVQSIFSIVATEDNTEVEITPTVPTSGGKPAGRPFVVTLNKGSVYQVGASGPATYSFNNNNNARDLTGTYIKSNKKIAVFGGHQCAMIPVPAVTACNVLCEQIPPINTWGKGFYVGALKSRSFYTYRVLASQDSTKIFEDTTLIAILRKGEFIQKNSRRNIQITSDKPVLVAQYSQGAQNGDNTGDPMMLLIPPVQQYLTRYRFATPVNGQWLHYINIFVPTKAISSVRINGQSLKSTVFNRFGNTRYSIANILLPYGSHYVECSTPFGLYSYGLGRIRTSDEYDAYGAMGGQSFLEYEPVPDLTPPIAETITNNRKNTVLVSDDERDDSGISEINLVSNNNLTVNIPKFTPGTPSVMLDPHPISPAEPGSCVFLAKDIAGNESFFTLCYIYDNTINEYVYIVNKGNNSDCIVSDSWLIGAFYSHSYNSYNSEFAQTGDIIGATNFDGLTGTSGIFGLSLSKYLISSFHINAKLILTTNHATFTSPDTNKLFVTDNNSNSYVPYFTSKEINLKNIGLGIDLGLDWKFSDYFYLSGGLSFNWNITKKADITENIVFPPGYEFPDAGTANKLLSNKLSTLSGLNMGLYLGPGVNCRIGYGLQIFADLNYYYYPFSLLNDADLFINKVNIKFGVRYQL